jgi:hypothetical protein
MGSIRTDSQSTIGLNQPAQGVQLDPDKPIVGKGMNTRSTETPPALPQESLDRLRASLAGFMKGGVAVDVEVLLVQVAVAMRDTEATSQKSKINTDQETKKVQLKEKEAKLEEAQRKMDEAEAKKKSGSLLDKIKLAFEWIGAILAMAVAAVMIATGAGAVVGALLMAAAVTSLILAIDSTVTMATGHGIAGNFAKMAGASEEDIAKADMGFKIGVAVAGVLFSIAGGGVSIVSAKMAAANAAKTGATAAATAGKVAGGTAAQGMKVAQQGLNASSATVAAGNAAMGVGASAIKYEETTLRADAKSLEAKAKQDEALLQMLDDLIDQALSRLIASSDRFNAMLDEIVEAMNDRSGALSRARFTG